MPVCFPNYDYEFSVFLRKFTDAAIVNAAFLELTPADQTALTENLSMWDTCFNYATHADPMDPDQSAIKVKSNMRDKAESLVRSFANR